MLCLHLVTDDNSSVRKILTHLYQDLIDCLQWTIDDWPRCANGKKKPDNGLLPILPAMIKFLADKGHRTRGCCRVFFAEAGKSKKDGCGCTKMDAERMKRRMSWTLRLHCEGTYKAFRTAVLAVLEHHFNDHEHCAALAGTESEEELRDTGLRFRCKAQKKELHAFMKKLYEKAL
jgi:hypothetical protein